MSALAATAVLAAAAADALVGEPPRRWHPTAWFGRAVAAVDRPWARPGVAGAAVAVALPLGAALVVGAAVAAAEWAHPVAGAAAAAATLFATTSLRMLCERASAVVAETTTDPDAARRHLRALAGRDAAALSPGAVRSAAVESLAENLADGLVAPLGAFALVAPVSLPGAAAAAAWVKAVNTLDSVLGYPGTPHGTASARLDDAVMYLPARASAVLLAAAAADPGALLRARGAARAPPSPNSGWPMATVASALDVRLEKPGAYALACGPALPTPGDADRAVRVTRRAGALAVVLAGVVAWW
ncbi:MAG: CobD/CbiB family cobalamin biosynthesis protein [Halobacteriaceae archaeon]